jgi:hypothetical protein
MIPTLEVPRLAAADRLVELPSVTLRRATDGGPALQKATVRVGLRDGQLLVRFDGRGRGAATLTERDAPLWKEEVFEVFLAPDDSPGLYYEFQVNPLGALFDARIDSPQGRRETMRVDASWNCAGLSARVGRREGGWTALLRIPLASLAAAQTPRWRANFYRIDRSDPEEFCAWSPTFADPPDFHRPDRFGLLIMAGG